MTTPSSAMLSSAVTSQDLGESSVDGSVTDYLQPMTRAATNGSMPTSVNDVQQTLVNYIGQYPLAAVGLAVATGVMLGCLVKRR